MLLLKLFKRWRRSAGLRITVKEVRAAYKKTGLVPIYGGFSRPLFAAMKACCPQTALYVAAGMDVDPLSIGPTVLDWARDRYGEDYACWFRVSFDRPDNDAVPTNERQHEGRDDGRAVRAALRNVRPSHDDFA